MNHHITVNVVIENQSAQFLMVRNKTMVGNGGYHFPGGHLKVNESLVDCAIREIREELNIVIQPEALIGLYQHHKTAPGFNIVFYASVNDHHFVMNEDEIESAEWMSLKGIQSLTNDRLLNPNKHHFILSDLMQNRRLSIELLGELIEEQAVV